MALDTKTEQDNLTRTTKTYQVLHVGRRSDGAIFKGEIDDLRIYPSALSEDQIGALFDRYGPRLVYVSGLLAYGAGFLVAARMTELWHGWVGLGLLGGYGAAATGMTPATGILSRWFDRKN